MPDIPDDDIIPSRPDFKWGIQMISFLIWIWCFTYFLFWSFSHFFIAKMSIEDERKYFWNFFIETEDKKFDLSNLSYSVNIPKWIEVYLKETSEVNAFASLWWNIIFTTGLLEKLQYEEEFIFILWHEIDHILSRDPLKWVTTQLPFYITLIFLWVDTSFDYGKIFDITTNYISRQIEIRADNGWIKYLKEVWWNPYCILPFFENKDDIFHQYLYFNSTHPTHTDRISNIQSQSIQKDFKNCILFQKNL